MHVQAINELTVLLEDNDIDYSETELVVKEEGTNSTIEGISEIFVSSWNILCSFFFVIVVIYMYTL